MLHLTTTLYFSCQIVSFEPDNQTFDHINCNFQLLFCFILMITWPELSPLCFGSKMRFDWSKLFEWLRRRCQHRLKQWPIKMGFRGVIWANVYGGLRWICRKVVPLHIGRCLWAHTRKNRPKFQRFRKGSDLTNFTIDSFCRYKAA
jgi:hypothetical protein